MCRCVSNSWASIIRPSNFSKRFLTKSSAQPQLLFSFNRRRKGNKKGEVCFMSLPQPQTQRQEHAGIPLAKFPVLGTVISEQYVNGLVFRLEEHARSETDWDPIMVSMIYNPSTGQSMTIPNANAEKSYIGYDTFNKVYKVLSMTCEDEDTAVSQNHQLLTLSGEQPSVTNIHCAIDHYPLSYGICIDGLLYYPASVNSSSIGISMIICFDVISETFVRSIEFLGSPNSLLGYLFNFNSKLGVYVPGYPFNTFSLWILEDPEKSSWSIQDHVPPSIEWYRIRSSARLKFAGMAQGNEIVWSSTPTGNNLSGFCLVYYNTEKKNVRTVTIAGAPSADDLRNVTVYTCVNHVDNLENPWHALPMEVPLLPVDKVIEITDNFGLKFLIGEGSYGKVYHATMDDGSAIALKKLDVALETDTFLSQISMVSRLKHENLIQLVGYCVADNLCVLAYEFATMGTLHDILHGAQPGKILDWIMRVKIAVEAARGLNYLHKDVQPPVIHGGIRSSNVLLFDGYQAKVSDFKLSNQAPDNAAHLHASDDVHSFGVVLLELLTGRKYVDLVQESLVTWATTEHVDTNLKGDCPLESVAKVAAVALSCVQDKPEFRPSMSKVVEDLQELLKLLHES